MPCNTQISDALRKALVDGKHTSRDGTVVYAPTRAVLAALEAALSGYVVVPREPTPEMLRRGSAMKMDTAMAPGHPELKENGGKYSAFEIISLETYRAMIQAAPPVASGHVVGWRTMDSAPKDGTWFLAYRPPSADWETLVVIGWDEESNDFVWPTENYDAYDPPDLNKRDAAGYIEVDVYESQGSFTHWQPLPAPPVPVEPNPTAGAS